MMKWMMGFLGLIIFILGMPGVELAWPQGGSRSTILHSSTKPMGIPDFSLENLQGKVVQIKEFRGKIVLLHFWATW